MKRTLILAILDGWGIGDFDEGNPIYVAKPPNFTYLQTHFPSSALNASSIAVGLPWEEPGGSVVGHLTIGAGRVIYQPYPKITMAIQSKSFFENRQLKKAFDHTKESNAALHLIGLLSDGNVHSSIEHLTALIKMARQENHPPFFVHLITDGKDCEPRSSSRLLEQVEKTLKDADGSVASVTGRFYAMDEDGSWERTEKAWNVLLGKGANAATGDEALRKAREKKLEDEFVEPTVIGTPHPIQENDAIIFFNFRGDGLKQLAEPFLNQKFDKFPTLKFTNLFITTLTQYHEEFKANVAFPPETIENPLGKVLADHDKVQLRIAETQKQNHVTSFFNGLEEKPYPNEYRVMIPSLKTPSPETHPEMMTQAITDRVLMSLNEGVFDFILLNYANPDAIAHTGNFDATLKAIKITDECLGRLLKSVIEQNHILILTADHGNAENVLNLKTGEPETKHNLNPVPFIIAAREFQKSNPAAEPYSETPTIGMLADIAPTILELMKIPQPKEMTGESLLSQLI